MGQYMVATTETLLGGRILELISCPVYDCVHLDGPIKFCVLIA